MANSIALASRVKRNNDQSKAKRKLLWKRWKKRYNLYRNRLPKPKVKRSRNARSVSTLHHYSRVKAPAHLSLINNPEGTISFLEKLKYNFDNEKRTFVMLREVQTVEDDAIVLLLSIMVRFKSRGIYFNGDYPMNRGATRKLIRSGFFEHLYKDFTDADRYALSKENGSTLHTHAYKNVDSALSAKIIAYASEFVWGIRQRCQGVQRTLLELMLNTNNHASIEQGEKHWWLSVTYDRPSKVVKFSFVDYGVGIFTSLTGKKEGTKFFGALPKLFEKFKPSTNGEILQLILAGDLHKTATGQHFRGKGLPGIKEAQDRGWISNLHIVTNDVFADTTAGTYRTLIKPFLGTFIYWELRPTNKHCNATNPAD